MYFLSIQVDMESGVVKGNLIFLAPRDLEKPNHVVISMQFTWLFFTEAFDQ